MNSKDLLLLRISTLIDQLDSAKKTLEAGDAWLQKRTGNDLNSEIEDLRSKLLNDQHLAQESDTGPSLWATLDTREASASVLFRECLAYYQGVKTRNGAQTGVLFRMADELLDSICSNISGLNWNRFTILADGESFVDLTQIIRLRFPMRDIWNLPVAAHEFGHFLAQRLNVKGAGQKHRLVFADYLADHAPSQDRTGLLSMSISPTLSQLMPSGRLTVLFVFICDSVRPCLECQG